MTTIDLKDTIQEYINTADIRLLKMIKALVESYQSDEQETIVESDLEQRAAASLQSIEKGETRSIVTFKKEVDQWKSKQTI